MENGGEGGGGCNFESILDIEYESNNRIVLPRFSLNGESKLGGWAVTRAIHGAIPALRFLYRRFPPPPFFEPSQGMGLTTSYKNVVRVSLHLQGFTISPKKAALSATRVGARTMRSGEKVGVDLCEKVVESKVKLT